jgi:DNA-binding SARP family transcriptional activator
MASADAGVRRHLLGESLAAWREVGNPIQIALAELALARAESAVRSQAAAETAERRLRRMGFGLSASGAAGLGRSIARGPSDAPVEIRVLGGFQLLRHGEPVAAGSWQSRKARDLLKILVTRRGRPVPRESLAEALWPEDGTDSVASRLSVALSTVRAVLDPGHDHPADQFVTADASSIALRTDRVRVDLEIFFATVDAALAARGADARELLEAAEAAYTGDLLEEDPHAEWAVALRERARAAYIRVAHTLADLALRAGDHQDAVDLFLRILERDGYDEPAHLGLVAALETAGRHGEARRAHAAYGGRMRELGVPTAPFPAPQAARTSP